MARLVSVVLALVLVVAAVPVAPVAAATVSTAGPGAAPMASQQTTDRPSDQASDPSPGQQLAGVLGVQAAELEGEVETRRFDHAVNRSDTNVSRAEVVAAQIDRIQSRLTDLRTRLEELQTARENGEISEREYRIRVARIVAELRSLGRLAERTESVSGRMPLGLLEASGVNVTAAYAVSVETDRATDGDVDQVARSMAGADVGAGFETDTSRDRAQHLIATLDRMIAHATQIVGRSADHIPEDNERAVNAIETAQRHLTAARSARDSAARAVEAGDVSTAIDAAKESRMHLRRAVVSAHKARRYARVVDAKSDRASRAIEFARDSLVKADQAVTRAKAAGAADHRQAAPLYNRAREHLSTAQREYEAARSAMKSGNYEEAMRHAKQSIARSEVARRAAQAAAKRLNHDDQLTSRAKEAIATADRRVAEANDRVRKAESMVDDDQAAAHKALETARERLASAREGLAQARTALDEGNSERALRLARKAGLRAEAAMASARTAIRFAEADHDRTETDDRDRTATEEPHRTDSHSRTKTRSD